MRVGWIGPVMGVLAAVLPMQARAQSAATPTSPSSPRNPGAAATDAVTSPTRAPAAVAPAAPSSSGQVQYSAPPPVDPAAAQPRGALAAAEIRELLDAAGATAKATRESVDYLRVMPDILTQILTKLDKIEDKLDKVENAVKAQSGAPPRRR